jgi:hypothetical protein
VSAYRDNALVPMPVDVVPQGLVRKNGARCLCTPPGRLWCWWYSVQEGDRWFCIHGRAWERYIDYGMPPFMTGSWKQSPAQPEGQGE